MILHCCNPPGDNGTTTSWRSRPTTEAGYGATNAGTTRHSHGMGLPCIPSFSQSYSARFGKRTSAERDAASGIDCRCHRVLHLLFDINLGTYVHRYSPHSWDTQPTLAANPLLLCGNPLCAGTAGEILFPLIFRENHNPNERPVTMRPIHTQTKM